jgi:hypothetical protein
MRGIDNRSQRRDHRRQAMKIGVNFISIPPKLSGVAIEVGLSLSRQNTGIN